MLIATIDHTTLSELASTGMVRGARVVGKAGGWFLIVKHGVSESALGVQDSREMQIFPKLDALASYLASIGITRFDVDAVEYEDVDNGSAARPARSDEGAHAHDDAYTKWLKSEIQEAIDDPSPSIPHEEAIRQVRAAIRRQ